VTDFLDRQPGPERATRRSRTPGTDSGAFDFVELAPRMVRVVCTSAIFGSSKNSGAHQ